jgi:hypothetical protein
VTKVSWKHGVTVSASQAAQLLAGLRADLSRDLLPDLLTAQPQVLQVWFEPPLPLLPIIPSVPQLAGIFTMDGALRVAAQQLTWTAALTADILTRVFAGGGRLLLRIHCGNLLDGRRRVFSAATDSLFAAETLHLPGGVLESWFFVKAG